MAIQGKYWSWTITAGQALTNLTPATGFLYKAMRSKTGLFATNGREAVGVLQYGSDDDGYASVSHMGIMKYAASTAITSADILLTVTTSGYMKIAGSGDWIVGRTITAATSGMIASGMFNFATPAYYNPTENSSGT